MFEYQSVKTAILEVAYLEWNRNGTKVAVLIHGCLIVRRAGKVWLLCSLRLGIECWHRRFEAIIPPDF